MTTLTLAACLPFCLLSANPETYAEAHRLTSQTGKPLVVMVGTEWCGPCQQMKKTLPQVRERGLLGRVAFATVNADDEAELARKITGGGPVPQLVMFRRTPQGWMRRKLVGGQSLEAVEKFISEGLAQDNAEKAAEGQFEQLPNADERAGT